MNSEIPALNNEQSSQVMGASDEKVLMSHRADFGQVLEKLDLRGKGVEVGVCEGEYSFQLLSTWSGEILYSVDPWRAFGEEYRDINNADQEEQERRYQRVKSKLALFGDRSQIMRQTSLEASPFFDEASLDFVYLDAQHHYEAVREDIRAWYRKIKKGGVLAGHDYLDAVLDCGVFGVRRAVQEFSSQHHLEIYISGEQGNEIESWFLVKR